MGYSKFRGSSQRGEAVSVNHRALITRALTKYPVDHALFRELLQNSADAQATSATIQFESSSHDSNVAHVHTSPITCLKFSNDGLDFAKEDWARLREIASGNPNETKIGAFGVGFYSVFELTDEPLVHSGNQIMSFRYEGVQLHYFVTENAGTYQKGTLIDLPYKQQQQLNDLVDFVGFLVQSFLLVNLNEIELQVKYADGTVTELLHLTKATRKPALLEAPPGLIRGASNGKLKLSHLQKSDVRVTVDYLNASQMPPLSMSSGLFSFGRQLVSSLMTSPGNPTDHTVVTFNLTKVDAFVDVKVSSSFANEMLAILLKPPPKQAVMSVLSFTSKLPCNISSQLKSYIFPENVNNAKVFIGFSTKQSTGFRSHLALNQVVPTMERTVVDMSNKFVREWNCEMLYMSGIMARCAYEYELQLCQQQTAAADETAAFIISRFKFEDSTPDLQVGKYIQKGFWEASNMTLVPSTRGVLPNTQVKFSDAPAFLRKTPVIADDTLAAELLKRGLIKKVTNEEIANDIGSSPLPFEMCLRYVDWIIDEWPNLDDNARVLLFSALQVDVDGKVHDIGSAVAYHDRSRLPNKEVSAHLPPHCISSELATEIGISKLSKLGIPALGLKQWTEFRLNTMKSHSSTTNYKEKCASGILVVCQQVWPQLSSADRSNILKLLCSTAIIPTQKGLKVPRESYIKRIALFQELPVISENLELPASWLRSFGVRESMDMAFVLDALNKKQLEWTNEDLVQYLCENSSSLTKQDWMVLTVGKFFSAVGDGKSSGHKKELYTASELYAPDPQLQRLGIPTIDLSRFTKGSKEGNALYSIGLKQYPDASLLFANCRTVSHAERALQYFETNYSAANYSSHQISDLTVIPTERGTLVTPRMCYRDPRLQVFGFSTVSSRWEPAAARLGILKSPPLFTLLNLVVKDPAKFLTDEKDCNVVFTYFAERSGEITDECIKLCRNNRFIPVRSGGGSDKQKITWMSPQFVYLPSEYSNPSDILRSLLCTIHPGQSALPFLYRIGIRDQPNIYQIVQMFTTNPQEVYHKLSDPETYELILLQIGREWDVLAKRPDLVQLMKEAPFLVGLKYDDAANNNGKVTGERGLCQAKDLAIVDDVIIFNQFKTQVVTAPQDETLEEMYRKLGVPRLSRLLQERVQFGSVVRNEKVASELQQRIDDRLKLFVDNTSHNLKEKSSHKVTVKLVSSIDVIRRLPPRASVRISTSACLNPYNEDELLLVPGNSLKWIDVATALTKKVLICPNQDAVVVMEIQLSSELNELEKKGYNVGRLKAKKQKLFENLFRSNVQDPRPPSTVPQPPAQQPPVQQQLAKQPAHNPVDPLVAPPKMLQPVVQPNVPQPFAPQQVTREATEQQGKKKKGLFSSLVDSVYGTHSANTAKQPNTPQDIHQVPLDIQATLQSGLGMSRPYNRNGLNSQQHVDAPIPNAQAQCVPPPQYDLQMLSTLPNGIKLFSTSQTLNPAQDELVLSEVLLLLAEQVFGIPSSCVHLYRDQNVSTIAFNQGGSLFFNSCVSPDTDNVADYYYPVMAHELAHNLVQNHGAAHSFYTEAYVQHTLPKYRQA